MKKMPDILFLTSYFLLLSSYFLLLTPAPVHALPWSQDMFIQPSVKAQEDLPPSPPKGTAPFQRREKGIRNRWEAATAQNPVTSDIRSVARGKTVFETYCLVCHGAKGAGDGIVGKKFLPPTDLSDQYVQEKPDGDIYYTITYGGLAVMPRYGDAIPPEDRWHLINYIRTLGK